MRIAGLTLTAAALALAAPGVASAQFYLGGGVGLTQSRDIDDDTVRPDGVREAPEIDFDRGWLGSLAAGYKFDFGGRLELEGGYRSMDADNTGASFGGAARVAEDAAGDLKVFTAMLNAVYELNTGSGLMPYAGAGIGRAWIRLNDVTDPVDANNNRRYDGSDSTWAYQLIAGLAYGFTPNLAVTADYRYLASLGSFDFSGSGNPGGGAPGSFEGDLRNHSIMIGLRYTFGAPAAPPPPPAPAAAPAPPPAPVRLTQTFLVFFDFDSAQLTPAARDTIATAVNAVRAGGVARLQIVGHTDTSGSPAYNQRLGQRRADAVQGEMVRLGLPAGIIATRSAGESELRVRTADGVREAQNRRAEIILPGG
jgi:OOP family OmpA-OmpF porin